MAKQPVDYAAQLEAIDELFPMVRILDEEGKVVNEEIMPDLSDDELVELMKRMVFSRTLHERSMALAKQGRLGFYAPTYGQEASQMASSYAFEEGDWLFPGYRDIPQLIAKGLPIYKGFLWSRGHVEGNDYPEDLHAMPPQIIIGAQLIQAMGNAVGQKLNGSDNVTYVYTGDGGSSQGDSYEGWNYASRYKAPIVFFIQNNGFAISTPREKQSAAKTLAQKAVAAGIPGVQVDGNDALAVYAVAKQAREYAAAGNGPVLIETITNRLGAHSTSGDNPKLYRTDEDIELWTGREPLLRMRKFMEDKGLWNEDMETEYVDQVKDEIKEAIQKAEAAPQQKVSDFLKNMFENPGQNIKEQIEQYEAKESE
ncbi:pyruvate dehydrogenase (acetyl-transferring) E1 component subunit alpha [Aerococcus sanguinicola]|uniref:pyruvate dehydrogenase (acetyl-transferring) E1 component subunit alpha n=1 Tax=Aerococcus sanguinicola TaxID=119206 RepID=UPI0018A6D637|nr:pyruvate dehydrogenase (acetyl-transferring) E1 component subunit alpha [Aerococcus sanguinicola]